MFEKIIDLIKKNKKTALLCFLLILGIAFIGISGEEKTENEGELSLEEYKERLEEELGNACSSVEGVGRSRVVVTFRRGAENTYKGSNLIESKPPEVMGITVICSGADSDRVRAEIVEMMTSLFEIGTNRVSVLKLS